MAETKVARRYAKSLLDMGKERNITEQLFNDMTLVAGAIHDNRELGVLFKSPIVNNDKKEAIIMAIFDGKVNEVSIEFMKIINRKKREYYLEDIALSFIDLYKVFKHIQPAFVVTATKMDEKSRNEMLAIVKNSTGSFVDLKEIIDPSIIGGFILRWGDRQIDASVVHKLNALKQDFSKNFYLKDY
ncbi:MAG: ATP synthase F1 subunit delta [Bacteroidetes bacterium]|nr:ATP synthase F1 subunit delta [Bacteroidota bacterium]